MPESLQLKVAEEKQTSHRNSLTLIYLRTRTLNHFMSKKPTMTFHSKYQEKFAECCLQV